MEARVISPKGDCLSEKEEEGTRQSRSPMWSGFKDPEGRGTKRLRGTDPDESQLETRKDKNPSPPASSLDRRPALGSPGTAVEKYPEPLVNY